MSSNREDNILFNTSIYMFQELEFILSFSCWMQLVYLSGKYLELQEYSSTLLLWEV